MNGDDPEAAARVIRIAFEFRQVFKKDVVVDMICYRRYGHNEGDEPAFTQPRMYELIGARRSVRKLYTETLVNRGDISLEEAEAALEDFRSRLEDAFVETQATEPAPVAWYEHVDEPARPSVETGVGSGSPRRDRRHPHHVPRRHLAAPEARTHPQSAAHRVRHRPGRLGLGREPGVRLAVAGKRAGSARRAGHAARARSASATRRSSTTTPRPSTRRSRISPTPAHRS